jgi:hypothetical protein
MGQTIKLDLPDEVYRSLVASAQLQGQTPEDLAVHILAEGTQQVGEDPLDRFIGAFPSGMPGWSARHDEYIGREALYGARESADGDREDD